MKRVSVTELKNRLSEYLRLVKRGEIVEVVERSVPIAHIQRISDASRTQDARLQRLAAEGVLTLARSEPDMKFLDRPPVPCAKSAVKALIEDRETR
jgi:prevent-host-death family protein